MSAKIKTRPRPHVSRHRHKPKTVTKSAFEKVYWPYLPVILSIGLLLSFGGQSGALQSSFKHPTRVLDYATSMSVSGLLADTNNARVANGVAGCT
jgi:hypothetical protein